ncbi:MAG TPA: hypothetical protein O0W90_01465 [Methanocorpusculum sp.]|nr:hypothetical protein [Methanocorpusculum sp.]
METYLKVKKYLAELLDIKDDIDEENDITISLNSENNKIVFYNDELRKAYDNIHDYTVDKLEIYTPTSIEIAMEDKSSFRMLNEDIIINDVENGLRYTLGCPSLEYCMFLINKILEDIDICNNRKPLELINGMYLLRKRAERKSIDSKTKVLSEVLHIHTLKIESNKSFSKDELKSYAISFEFLWMYKKNRPIKEYLDIISLYPPMMRPLLNKVNREELDIAPKRIINADVMDYYTMAIESADPFIKYISYYHVVEYYFDAVFRKNLTDAIKNKLTHPDFSYKDEEKLYDLAKFIKKHMNNDVDSGKGNELESLNYVLFEYVPVDDLKKRINSLDPNAVIYYNENFVKFTTSKKTKINWTDLQSVNTNIANRVYETRNALVHSKSEQINNQYRPYEHKNELMKEIPLIRAIAELVLINSSALI